MNNQTAVVEIKNLNKFYNQGSSQVNVLTDLSLRVEAGEQIAIVGSSGSGKSTLLHLIGALDTPSTGSLMVDGKDIIAMNQKQRGQLRNQSMGFIYQFHHLLPEFTALENVAMPLLIGKKKKDYAIEQASEILEKVGLIDRLTHKPGELSGGERQRAAIARALVTKPKIVLADEPTGNLDEKTAERVYQLMLSLNQELGTSFIVVTHDRRLANRMGRTLLLTKGRLEQQI